MTHQEIAESTSKIAKAHATEAENSTENNDDEDEGIQPSIQSILILLAATGGSLYAYFNGWVVAIKNFSLGAHSMLVLSGIFGIILIYHVYSYIQEQRKEKMGK